jgi:cation diffusion facilitator CzcD-associated flavoprotein CzcO
LPVVVLQRHSRIAIIGAGFGGIGTAIRLRQRGYHDVVVFDRGGDVGGAWRDNSYPGCACDVPSHLYSFSFAPNPGWSRSFSPQPEILNYLRRCVVDYDLRPRLRLDHEVRQAAWDEPSRRWVLDTSRGRYTADILVAAGGLLCEPSVPDLPGLETFAGTAFHSARWDHGYDLAGRRVAVVGTGASAVQFVPAIAGKVARLNLFQRTPAWVVPRRDRPLSAAKRAFFGRFPAAQRALRAGIYWARESNAIAFLHPVLMPLAQRTALRHLRAAVPDPNLRARLTPGYTLGCKRVLLSDDFYPALARDNVELVTDPIAEVRPDAVVTRDGVAHPVDTIIFGTGFHVTDSPLARLVRGRDGRSLAEAWRDTMQAYQGITVSGFPNLFLLLGPNTGLGHNSVVFMIECQISYLLRALAHLDRTGTTAIEPTLPAQRTFVASVDRRMRGTVWSQGGCRSWYLDANGRNSTLWPGYTWTYWLRTRRFDPGAYATIDSPTERPS